jgi:hypothetical protein
VRINHELPMGIDCAIDQANSVGLSSGKRGCKSRAAIIVGIGSVDESIVQSRRTIDLSVLIQSVGCFVACIKLAFWCSH